MQCSRCCPICPRELSASGMTRHCRTCKTYQQFMDAGLRLIQQATRSALQARQQAARTALQARQQAVEAEKAGTEWIDPDVTVSFASLNFTLTVLTSHSPLALVKLTLAQSTWSHCHPHLLLLTPSLCRNPLCLMAHLTWSHCHPHLLLVLPQFWLPVAINRQP
jgi:hypothetical protein